MNDDAYLLRRYVDQKSEDAFTELVQRHVHLVYFAALRKVGGDAHLADDVTQRVFTDLARKAASLKNHPSLTGWLYTSTRFAAAQVVRSEQRRKNHEQEAHAMQELHPGQTPQADWDQLRPLIDEALDELGERDREAVLLRYFENLPFAEVAARFSLSPDAARMRVDRALEKLRTALARRGIVSTSVALGAAFAAQTATAVPTGLVQKVAAIVLSQTLPATGTTTVALWKIIAGFTAASLGISATFLCVKHLREQVAEAPSTIASPIPSNTTQPASAHDPTEKPVDTAAAAGAQIPRTVRRSTDGSGWPRVGLFAAEAGEKPEHTVAEFRAKMKGDPGFAEVVVAQAKENLDLFYGRLFRSLQLPPGQLELFKTLLVEKQRLHLEVADTQEFSDKADDQRRQLRRAAVEASQQALDSEIKTVLGETAYTSYLQYREDLVQWTVIEAVAKKLENTASPLTDEQTHRLLGLLREHLVKLPPPYTFDLAYGAGVFPPRIGAGLSPRLFKRAREFLSPPQIEVLRQLRRPNTEVSPLSPP